MYLELRNLLRFLELRNFLLTHSYPYRWHIQPGPKALSNQWQADNNVNRIPVVQHGTVNSLHFVCPVTFGIESYWAQGKLKLKMMKGIQFKHLEGYFEEHMWRDRNGGSSKEAFLHIVRDFALRYL
jgi:hypothetical protein